MRRFGSATTHLPLAILLASGAAACGGEGGEADGAIRGAVVIDGSSTVYPITEAVAEEFIGVHRGNVRVTVGISGTGGGFKRFCAGETDMNDASRPIKETEAEECRRNGIEYFEMPIAYDGLSVVVHPGNEFAGCLTVAELRRIWEPGSTIQNWSQVRPGFPDMGMKLYGPGTDSGTFDYFTEVIVGREAASRSDFTRSEDDNVLVQGVAGDAGALGYFGYAYYEENAGRLTLVAVDEGNGCVLPEPVTIQDGSYSPLSRPVFLYVGRQALERPAVREFVRFYMEHAGGLTREVGYIALEEERYRENLRHLPAPAPATDPSPDGPEPPDRPRD